ncbi:MAG: hypothetical protein ACHQJ6_00010 [Candidatus Berkiellales bacterium]
MATGKSLSRKHYPFEVKYVSQGIDVEFFWDLYELSYDPDPDIAAKVTEILNALSPVNVNHFNEFKAEADATRGTTGYVKKLLQDAEDEIELDRYIESVLGKGGANPAPEPSPTPAPSPAMTPQAQFQLAVPTTVTDEPSSAKNTEDKPKQKEDYFIRVLKRKF